MGQELARQAQQVRGPHDVIWDSPGLKAITLEVVTDRGCVVTDIQTITVDPCCDTRNRIDVTGIASELLCNGDGTGQVDITVTSAVGIVSYEWSKWRNYRGH